MNPTSLTVSIPLPGARARWLAAGLAIGLLGAALAGPALAPRPILATDPTATTIEHTISVSGTGRVVISPDVADLRLGVLATAKTVKAARQASATAMTAVLAAVKKLGVADKDIQTTVLSLSPTYDYSSNTNPPRLTGYSLSNGIAITVRNLDTIGDVIDNALAAGATSMDSITFRAEDQTGAEQQARQSAMAEAKAKAQTLAAAASVTLGGVASISETVAPIPYPVYYGAMAAAPAKDVQTPVQPGTNEVSVTVSVVFLIG
jgi:uncharacterized protein YggE